MRVPRPVCLAVLFAHAAAAAASAGADKPPVPVFDTSVSLVAVPVFVADAQGRAMPGLQAADFELYDDKKRVPIVSFQYIDTTSDDAQDEIKQAPAARRRFLLLFDMSFTDPGGVMRAREAARDFVRRRLAESDLAAVATFDINRGTRIVANFTEDRALLVHAVDTLGVPSLAQIEDPLSLVSTAQTDTVIDEAETATINTALADSIQRVLAQQLRKTDEAIYRARVLQLMEGLKDLARGLASVQGRKHVVYFSAGFDSHVLVGATGADMRQASEAVVRGQLWEVNTESRYGDPRLRNVFVDVAKTLSNSDTVVHSVDVTGLGRDNSLTQIGITRDPSRLSSASTAGRESLGFLAAETGGRFFKDTNDLQTALSELNNMTSRYYILGYQPDDLRGPGKFHDLKVKVARKKAKVSHRAGYHEKAAPGTATRLQRQFESAQLLMTGAGANDLKFSSLSLPFPTAGEKQTLGVVLQIPMDELGRNEFTLQVYGYAVADDGMVRDHLAQVVRVNPALADPEGTARGLSLYGTLRVPPGRYTLRLMVERPGTGSAGVQFIEMTVPPYDARAGFLLPPVVMDDMDRWLSLNLEKRAEAGRTVFPFSVDGRPFLPRTSFAVERNAAEKLVLMSFEPDRPRDPAAQIEIHSSLTDATGGTVPPGPIRIERILRGEDGRRTYVLAYKPEDVAPGDYTLRIRIGEGSDQLESYALLKVRKETGRP